MGLLPVPNQVYGRVPCYLKNINMTTTNGSSYDEETSVMEEMAKLKRRIEEQDRRIEEQDQIIEGFRYKDDENFYTRGNGESQPEVPHNKRKRVHASGPDQVHLVTRPRDVAMKHHPEYEGNHDFSQKGKSSPTPIFDGEMRKSGENMDENSGRLQKKITQNKTTSHMSSKQRSSPSLEIGTKVILKSSTYPNKRRVAYATILGTQVQVNKPIEEDENLVRERQNCTTIGDAFASRVPIAWPSACIEKING